MEPCRRPVVTLINVTFFYTDNLFLQEKYQVLFCPFGQIVDELSNRFPPD